ncbi:hypothetical protein MRAB57_1247 [Mycobacterium rhizamassiliense]|uniref:3-methyladenine DNA glycosylase Tag n=1 Tax=Mycobacterium rhizamassiliense TaxID=1841860 RepID=A0A2U3NPS2_9MYCO|nr:hypothetical protein MRAB57_1247 [Mycobacterium rhizamassiliense]
MKAMAGVGMAPELPTVVTGVDGIVRCRWATETGRDLRAYHDHEWGKPTRDEARLFEALVLTYFENGLSWAIVFDKRDNLRAAFHGFDPPAVAAMTPADVDRLMGDASIVRNRRKIEATVHNAHLLSKCSLATGMATPTAHPAPAAQLGRRPDDEPGVGRSCGVVAAERVSIRWPSRRALVHADRRNRERPLRRLFPRRRVGATRPRNGRCAPRVPGRPGPGSPGSRDRCSRPPGRIGW